MFAQQSEPVCNFYETPPAGPDVPPSEPPPGVTEPEPESESGISSNEDEELREETPEPNEDHPLEGDQELESAPVPEEPSDTDWTTHITQSGDAVLALLEGVQVGIVDHDVFASPAPPAEEVGSPFSLYETAFSGSDHFSSAQEVYHPHNIGLPKESPTPVVPLGAATKTPEEERAGGGQPLHIGGEPGGLDASASLKSDQIPVGGTIPAVPATAPTIGTPAASLPHLAETLHGKDPTPNVSPDTPPPSWQEVKRDYQNASVAASSPSGHESPPNVENDPGKTPAIPSAPTSATSPLCHDEQPCHAEPTAPGEGITTAAVPGIISPSQLLSDIEDLRMIAPKPSKVDSPQEADLDIKAPILNGTMKHSPPSKLTSANTSGGASPAADGEGGPYADDRAEELSASFCKDSAEGNHSQPIVQDQPDNIEADMAPSKEVIEVVLKESEESLVKGEAQGGADNAPVEPPSYRERRPMVLFAICLVAMFVLVAVAVVVSQLGKQESVVTEASERTSIDVEMGNATVMNASLNLTFDAVDAWGVSAETLDIR